MEDRSIERERAHNLWVSFARKLDPVARATQLEPLPEFDLARIGGLEAPKEEIQTYACAATSPEVYARWGTYPPSGLLLIGLVTLRLRGDWLGASEVLRGARIVPASELAQALRRRREASDLAIGGQPLVKGSETQHVLTRGDLPVLVLR